ncbi:hypothetical protein JCM19000A_28790 [Silvimonas sp. JCM 19000]
MTNPFQVIPPLLSRLRNFYTDNRLALRLVAAVIVTSVLVALSLAFFLARQEYQRSLTQIRSDLETLSRTVRPQLAVNLWLVNTEAVRTQLNSLLQTKVVGYAELVETDGSRYQAGQLPDDHRSVVSMSFPVEYLHPLTNKAVRLGQLTLVNTLDGLEAQIFDQMMRILLLLATGMFAAALCFILLYHRLIARHLRHIADFTRHFNYESLTAPLVLARRDTSPDELQTLADAFNAMRRNLQQGLNERDQAQHELIREKELAEATLGSVADAIITTTADGRVKLLNPAAETLTGWMYQEALGRPITEVVATLAENGSTQLIEMLDEVQAGKHPPRRVTATVISRLGQRYRVEMALAAVPDADGIGFVVALHDISEAEALTARLAYQATHDELTSLTNRRGFMSALVHANETVRSGGKACVLMQLDLDQFKLVNDTCGHLAGDELLRQLARLLQEMVPIGVLVGRLGGDEFGVLVPGEESDGAQALAERILMTLEQYRFVWHDRPFTVTGSMGLVNLDADAPNLQEVISRADVACFAAKEAGRNRYSWYRGGEVNLEHRHNELQLLATLRQAAEQNWFQLYFQPIVAANGQGEPHYEVLLRLVDATGKVISPGAFIPAAERYDLMATIDRWVIAHTLAEINERMARGEKVTMLSVNLSGKSLTKQTLAFVLEQLDESKVPPDLLCFEITETSAIANIKESTLFIEALRLRGCRFALDDFGSGFSSFTYLKTLPVDYLKIDGSLVRDVVEDHVSRQMVIAVNRIAHAMGRQTIAEYVESAQIAAKLTEIGVDYLQGYHIGMPRPSQG